MPHINANAIPSTGPAANVPNTSPLAAAMQAGPAPDFGSLDASVFGFSICSLMDFLSQNCGLSQIGSAAAYVMRPPPTSIAVHRRFISLILKFDPRSFVLSAATKLRKDGRGGSRSAMRGDPQTVLRDATISN
jgi:hypothetical protein